MDDIEASISALKESNVVQDVRLDVVPEASGVRISFVLQPAYYMGMYQFPGALNVFSYARLLQIANYPMQGPYSPVTYATPSLRWSSNSVVAASSVAGKEFARFGRSASCRERDLLHGPESSRPIWRIDDHRHDAGASCCDGEISSNLDGTNSAGRNSYRSAVFQSPPAECRTVPAEETRWKRVRVCTGQIDSARYTAESNRADIDFTVTPGPRSMSKRWAHVCREGRVRRLVPIYQENLFNDEMVQEGRQNLPVIIFNPRAISIPRWTRKSIASPRQLTSCTRSKRGTSQSCRASGYAAITRLTTDALMPNVTVKKKRFPFSRGSL